MHFILLVHSFSTVFLSLVYEWTMQECYTGTIRELTKHGGMKTSRLNYCWEHIGINVLSGILQCVCLFASSDICSGFDNWVVYFVCAFVPQLRCVRTLTLESSHVSLFNITSILLQGGAVEGGRGELKGRERQEVWNRECDGAIFSRGVAELMQATVQSLTWICRTPW